jgi:predicted amidophosphoribosyltransferase
MNNNNPDINNIIKYFPKIKCPNCKHKCQLIDKICPNCNSDITSEINKYVYIFLIVDIFILLLLWLKLG